MSLPGTHAFAVVLTGRYLGILAGLILVGVRINQDNELTRMQIFSDMISAGRAAETLSRGLRLFLTAVERPGGAGEAS